MENIEKIKKAGAKLAKHSLEWGCWKLLCEMAGENAQWAELIAQDITVKTMNIGALAKHMTAYAKKNKQGSSFYMGEELARQLIVEFYKLPEGSEENAAEMQHEQEESKRETRNINLMDLL